MAYDHLENWDIGDLDLNEDELAAIDNMKKNNGKIQKGEIYVRQFCEWEGEHFSWIANIEINDICYYHNLYDD